MNLWVSYILGNKIQNQSTGYIFVTDSKSIELQTTDYPVPSHIIPERYVTDRSRVSNEISHRGKEQEHNTINIKTATRILFVFLLVDPFFLMLLNIQERLYFKELDAKVNVI